MIRNGAQSSEEMRHDFFRANFDRSRLYTLLLIHHGNVPPVIKELTRRAASLSDGPRADHLHTSIRMLIGQYRDAFKQKCEDPAR